ncbi:MAG: F0F1 ATP synthase subunit A [Actinobacteria bacterium]|nr:F0F1 ATP synthase subunit A [Actinomycetota bacterium]MCB9389164.1 F0F1 ATP synthase subunit A [Acidimicrobiia bacterium]
MLALEFPPISHLFEWKDLFFKGNEYFAFNKVALLCVISALLVMAFFLAASRKQALVPTGVQNVGEMAYGVVEDNIVVEVMGEKGRPWTPFLASLFFYILFLNLWEIFPFIQFPPTSRMAIPLFLALQTWVIYLVVGFKHQGLGYIKNSLFPPGVPAALYLLVTPIEFVSVFIMRPFSLAVRLFANLMAGHILLVVFFVLAAALWSKTPLIIIWPLPVLVGIALTGFELMVAVIQAYIFTMLTAVYVSDSMEAHH